MSEVSTKITALNVNAGFCYQLIYCGHKDAEDEMHDMLDCPVLKVAVKCCQRRSQTASPHVWLDETGNLPSPLRKLVTSIYSWLAKYLHLYISSTSFLLFFRIC